MDFYVDWNCKAFPSVNQGGLSMQDALGTLEYLFSRDRISHFCMMTEYTESFGSIPAFLLLRRSSEEALKDAVPKHLKIRFATSVPLSPDLHLLSDLDKLYIPRTNILPITLPIAAYADWIDLELNRLLYRNRLRLWFVALNSILLFYPKEALERLFRISNAVYQFGYRSLSDPMALKWIRYILRINPTATILLGTGVDCIERASFHPTSYHLQSAASSLTPMELQTLLHHGRAFWKH